MLDLSRIDAGLTLELSDVDLAAIADAQRERVAMLSPDLTITRTGEQAMPVHADAHWIDQILRNLIDNARRHTPPGGHIVIDVRTTDHQMPVKPLRAPNSPSPTRARASQTPTATASSTGWCGWTQPATKIGVGPGWAFPSPGRWRAPTAASWHVCRARAARNSG
jgi:signal transduction histidine kinase